MEELKKEFENKFVGKNYRYRVKVHPEKVWQWIEQKLNQEIDNWEVHGSNSGCTGIVYNHPKKGDESVCLKNKITNKTVYKVLGK